MAGLALKPDHAYIDTVGKEEQDTNVQVSSIVVAVVVVVVIVVVVVVVVEREFE